MTGAVCDLTVAPYVHTRREGQGSVVVLPLCGVGGQLIIVARRNGVAWHGKYLTLSTSKNENRCTPPAPELELGLPESPRNSDVCAVAMTNGPPSRIKRDL